MWPQVNSGETADSARECHAEGTRESKERPWTNACAHCSRSVQLAFSGANADEITSACRIAERWGDGVDGGGFDGGKPRREQTKLQAELALDFGPRGKARTLNATGAVQSEREAPGHGVQTASAATGVVQFSPAGRLVANHAAWKREVAGRGSQRRSAASVFTHAAQTTVLTGQAVVRDASSETRRRRSLFCKPPGTSRRKVRCARRIFRRRGRGCS